MQPQPAVLTGVCCISQGPAGVAWPTALPRALKVSPAQPAQPRPAPTAPQDINACQQPAQGPAARQPYTRTDPAAGGAGPESWHRPQAPCQPSTRRPAACRQAHDAPQPRRCVCMTLPVQSRESGRPRNGPVCMRSQVPLAVQSQSKAQCMHGSSVRPCLDLGACSLALLL